MNLPIEDLIQQMSLKHPSDELDRRIAELIVEYQIKSASESKQTRRSRWARLATTAATFMALGLVLGFLIARDGDWRTRQSNPRAEADGPPVNVIGNSQSMNRESGSKEGPEQAGSSDALAEQGRLDNEDEPRTRIVTSGLVRTPEGELKRAYRTLTAKRYVIFDPESKSFFDVEIEIPRVVLTNRPEI